MNQESVGEHFSVAPGSRQRNEPDNRPKGKVRYFNRLEVGCSGLMEVHHIRMEYYTRSNHFIERRIARGLGTSAHWCKRNPEYLFIFVHGFRGTAEGTWFDITSELRSDDRFRTSDLLFVGYDSTNPRALISARLISSIIRDFVQKPEVEPNKQLYYIHRRPKFRYKKVIVFCHSLGAALMRRVAVDFSRQNDAVLCSLELVLFAPAHKGAILHSLFDNITSRGVGGGFLAWMRNILFYKRQVLFDLGPGCNFISTTEEETVSEIEKTGNKQILIAERIFFGVNENVVEVADFARDRAFETLENEDHVSLVKTTPERQYVLDVCRGIVP